MAEGPEHEALVDARRRVAQHRQTVGERHPDYATSLNQLALLLIMHGDPQQAESLLRESLTIRQETLGEHHPDYATNLSSLGGLLWARGDLDSAEPMLRRALHVRGEVLGPAHPKTIASRDSLEQLVRARSERDEQTQPAPVSQNQGLPTADPAPTIQPLVVPNHVGSVRAEVPPPVTVAPPPATAAPAPVAARAPVAVAPVVSAPAASSKPKAPVSVPEPKALSSAHDRAALVLRIKTLSSDFSRVSDRLANEVERWKAGGVPPSEALILDLTTCGREFASLRDESIRLAETAGLPSQGRSLASLREIESLFREISEVESRREQVEAVRSRAIEILNRVCSLENPDQREFAPLVQCKSQAENLRRQILSANALELPEAATQLAEGDHPFYRLLALVDGTESLSDDLWANSLDVVEHEFGKPLAVAIARAKVVLPA